MADTFFSALTANASWAGSDKWTTFKSPKFVDDTVAGPKINKSLLCPLCDTMLTVSMSEGRTDIICPNSRFNLATKTWVHK